MIEDLKNNIDNEMDVIRELAGFVERLEHANQYEKRVFTGMVNSLKKRIRFMNNSVPEILKDISLTKELTPRTDKTPKTQRINIRTAKTAVVLRSKDKEGFLEELNISEGLIKKIKKKKLINKDEVSEFKKPSTYGKMANKLFFNVSERWVREGKFKKLGLELRRSNLNILTTTYISMMLFSIVLSIILGIIVMAFLMFFSVGLQFPFINAYSGSYLERFLKVSWIIIAVPVVTWISFYFFPSAEKRALAGKIDQELPFVVIHMSSISGSGIEPIEIFKIIGLSKEYKYTKKEIRKILNQTNIYGYDLTNALRNVSLATPSAKLAELLNGISTTINSGGDIKTFFEKRAESLLLEYRLEREKFTKTAETFMDIYISIVIAAPMILLMLLVMISVSGIQTGFGINQMTIAIIGIVAMVNILFLMFLHLKQPTY